MHLYMGLPFEQKGRSNSAVKKRGTSFMTEDLKCTYVVQQHCVGRDTHIGCELKHNRQGSWLLWA